MKIKRSTMKLAAIPMLALNVIYVYFEFFTPSEVHWLLIRGAPLSMFIWSVLWVWAVDPAEHEEARKA